MNRIVALVVSAMVCWGGAIACSGGGGKPEPVVAQSGANDVKLPDGSIQHGDGSISLTDGSVKYPDGTVKEPTGIVRKPDGTVVLPAGTVSLPGGLSKLPSGEIVKADGTIANIVEFTPIVPKVDDTKKPGDSDVKTDGTPHTDTETKPNTVPQTVTPLPPPPPPPVEPLHLALKLQGFSMEDPYYYTTINNEPVFTKITFTTGDGYLSFDVKDTTGSNLVFKQLKLTDPDGDTVFNVIPSLDKYISFIPQMAGVYTISFTAEAGGTTKTETYKFQILAKPSGDPVILTPKATISGVVEGGAYLPGTLKISAENAENIVEYHWALTGPNLTDAAIPEDAAFTKVTGGIVLKDCGGCSTFDVILPAPIAPSTSSEYTLDLILTSSTNIMSKKTVAFKVKAPPVTPLIPSADLQGFPANNGHYSSDNEFALTAVNAKNVAKYGWKLSGPNLKTATPGAGVTVGTLPDSATILTKECSDCVNFSFGSPVVDPSKTQEYKLELMLTSSTGDQVSKVIMFYIEGPTPPEPKLQLIPTAVISGLVDKQIVAAGSYTVKADNSTNVSQYAWKLKGPKGEQVGDGATFTLALSEPNVAGTADSFTLTLTLTSITGDITNKALSFQVAAKPAPVLWLGGASIQSIINVIADHPLYASKPYSLSTSNTTGVGLTKVTFTITNPLNKIVLTQSGTAGGQYTYNFPLSGDYKLLVDAEGMGGTSSVEYTLTISDEP